MLSTQKSKSRRIQAVIDALLSSAAYQSDTAHRRGLQHISCDGNIMSDLVSRGLWEQFGLSCLALRIRPISLKLRPKEAAIIRAVIKDANPDAAVRMEAHLRRFVEEPRPKVWRHGDSGGTTSPASSRSRMSSPTEQGRGRARRDNSDGDGPSSDLHGSVAKRQAMNMQSIFTHAHLERWQAEGRQAEP